MLKSHKRMLNRYFYNEEYKPVGLLPQTLDKFNDEFSGEIKLLIAIMETSISDLDYEYILGDGLQIDCDVLDLDYKAIRAAFVGMAEMIKLNKPWLMG